LPVATQLAFSTAWASIKLKNQTWPEGEVMGDKGGKKDKEKNKQQQVAKQKQEKQKKQDKTRPKTP
jgi:hypothetical protein